MEQKDIQELQEEVRLHSAPLQLIKSEMGRIIAGQGKLVDRLLLALIADGHVLLKLLLSKLLPKPLTVHFRVCSLHPICCPQMWSVPRYTTPPIRNFP